MSRAFAALVLGGAALVAGCSTEGKTREPTELQDIAGPVLKPAAAWSESAGSGAKGQYTGLRLSLEADALFAADADGTVYAFDPATGKAIWRAETKSRVVSGPTASGNSVLVGTLDADVIALKRSDGAEQWRSRLSSEVMAPPVGAGNIVIARTVDGHTFGLSADTGVRLWTLDRSVPNLTLRGLSEPLVQGTRAYIGLDNGRVVAFNVADGAPAWEQAVAVAAGRSELDRLTDIDAPLMGEGPEVYAASFGGEVASVEASNGEVQWRRSVKSYAGMALLGPIVAVSDESGVVWGLDAATGAAAWSQEALKYRKLSRPAAFGNYIVVGDFEGYLHWLDPKDGRIVARTRVGSDPILSAPVAGEQMLYVLNSSGRISAVRAN
ncbi:MAG TPA: outer membrane protein assembly factor BamB [Solimonas sp.]|nr:outer membrane protein assembly factor BamB [Solimonas sp.]